EIPLAVLPLLKDPEAGVRKEALHALERKPMEGAAERLLPLLDDPVDDVSWKAVLALRRHVAPSLLPKLVELLGTGTPKQRNGAADLLLIWNLPKAAPDLLKLIEDEDPNLRSRGISAADQFKAREMIPALLKRLDQRGIQPGEESHILGVLGNLGAKEAIPAALQRLTGSPAGMALSTLARLEAREAIPAIIPLLRDPETFSAAAQALVHLEAREAIPELLRIDPVLVRFAPDEALKETRRLLRDPRALERRRGLVAIHALKGREATPEIAGLLDDPDPDLRRGALEALRRVGGPEADAAALRLLADPYEATRTIAVSHLGHTRPDLPEIRALRKDPAPRVRQAVARALGTRDDIPALLVLLDDRDPDVGGAALSSLAELRVREAIPGAIKLLKKTSSPTAAEALARFGVREAIPELTEAMHDPDGSHAWKVAEALARLGSREGVPLLVREGRNELTCLNALRRPDEWKRLADRSPSKPFKGTGAEALAFVAREAGLTLELKGVDPVLVDLPEEITLDERLLDILERLRPGSHEIIVESDRIRIVGERDGRNFWNDWWDGEEKKR
ncbi:MAG TPA: HEAT repeat domain-containing protein, partial [Planctomycetota bacterium]|nr:HEAT repeat domain-containing protein [Planctomycetota bacterium]